MVSRLVLFSSCVLSVAAALSAAGAPPLGSPAEPADSRWPQSSDVLVGDSAESQIRPEIARAPSGELFTVVEVVDSNDLRIYRSTDDGASWLHWYTVSDTYDLRHPSLVVGDTGGAERWLHIVFDRVVSGGTHEVWSGRIQRPLPTTSSWVQVGGPGSTFAETEEVRPRIVADSVMPAAEYNLHVVFPLFVVDSGSFEYHYAVYVARSGDRGLSWSAPMDVSGFTSGDPFLEWMPRPAIAAGQAGLFVAFEKPGFTLSGYAPRVWVARSSDGGAMFGTPQQLGFSDGSAYHPSLAAARESPLVLVAYTDDSASQLDLWSFSSPDGGTTWSAGLLADTVADEQAVALAEGRHGFYAAYTIDPGWRVWATFAPFASPARWSDASVVDNAAVVSAEHPHPGLVVGERQDAGEHLFAVWTDARANPPGYRVYLNDIAFVIFADGFESEDLSAWSVTQP